MKSTPTNCLSFYREQLDAMRDDQVMLLVTYYLYVFIYVVSCFYLSLISSALVHRLRDHWHCLLLYIFVFQMIWEPYSDDVIATLLD